MAPCGGQRAPTGARGAEGGLFDAPGQSEDKERVRDASDIVRVIGEHVSLKAKGREYLGLCPFHDDHTPSMNVVPSKQIFHCFSCDTGGDVFTFVQKYHRMTFPEALEYLAQRAGIELTARRVERSSTGAVSRRDVIKANEVARDFFRVVLRHPEHGARARDLIARRAISEEMVERFEIGAAPRTDDWDGLLRTIRNKGFDESHFLHAGLLKRRERDGSLYDAFRDRVVFPITNQAGQVVAFGARRIDDNDNPKYLNSAESDAFDKSSILYAMSQAARSIQRERVAIVCEGYTDVIACHQAGLTNVVATLGTAFTSHHADVLARLDAGVVLLFDGDEAGERAADRAVEVVFARPIDVRIALLTSIGREKDPDELLKTPDGLDRLRALMHSAPDILEYRFTRLRSRLSGAGSAEIERAIEAELARLVELGLGRVPPVRRQLMIRRLSEITNLPASLIARSIPAGRRAGTPAPARAAGSTARRLTTLEHLLGCVLCEGTLWSTLDKAEHELMAPDRFEREDVRSVAATVARVAREGHEPGIERVLDALDEEGSKAAAVALWRRVDSETEHDSERLKEHWHECFRQLQLDATRQVAASGAGAFAMIESLRGMSGERDNRVLPRAGQDAAGHRP